MAVSVNLYGTNFFLISFQWWNVVVYLFYDIKAYKESMPVKATQHLKL